MGQHTDCLLRSGFGQHVGRRWRSGIGQHAGCLWRSRNRTNHRSSLHFTDIVTCGLSSSFIGFEQTDLCRCINGVEHFRLRHTLNVGSLTSH